MWESRVVAIGALLLATVFAGSASACTPPDQPIIQEHFQGEDGNWYVLEAQRPDSDDPGPAEIHVFDSAWGHQRTVLVERGEGPDKRTYSSFSPAEGGGWWLEANDGTYYQVDSWGNLTGRNTETRPASFGRTHEDPTPEVDVDNELDGGSVVSVARGTDGRLWALSSNGGAYKYTSYGQFTGESHDVLADQPASCGSLFAVLFDAVGTFLLLTAGFVLAVVRVEELVSSVGYYVLSVALAATFELYWLPSPLDAVYLVPDGLLLALGPLVILGQILAIYEYGRQTSPYRDVPYLVVVNLPLLIVGARLVG